MSGEEILKKVENNTKNFIYSKIDVEIAKIDKDAKNTSFIILSDSIITISECIKAIIQHIKKHNLKEKDVTIIIISTTMLKRFDKQSDGKFSQTLFSNTSNI